MWRRVWPRLQIWRSDVFLILLGWCKISLNSMWKNHGNRPPHCNTSIYFRLKCLHCKCWLDQALTRLLMKWLLLLLISAFDNRNKFQGGDGLITPTFIMATFQSDIIQYGTATISRLACRDKSVVQWFEDAVCVWGGTGGGLCRVSAGALSWHNFRKTFPKPLCGGWSGSVTANGLFLRPKRIESGSDSVGFSF